MNKMLTVPISVYLLLTPARASAQGIFEGGGVHASAAGLGAGMAASANHGRVITRSYESVKQSQEAMLAQTRAMTQYMELGAQYQTKKQWQNAEKSFRYVLQVSALRDGPGSEKSLPALQRLVVVCRAQNELEDAVGFQKRVVGLIEKGNSYAAALGPKIDLSNLYMEKEEFSQAEPVLAEPIENEREFQTVPAPRRIATLKKYALVLRKLKKDAKAQSVEDAIAREELAQSTGQSVDVAAGSK